MILHTSGTTGTPKEIIYTDGDFVKVQKSMDRFYEIWPIKGTVYNLFKAGNNLSFIAANGFGKASGSKTINLETLEQSNAIRSCPTVDDEDRIGQLAELSHEDKPAVVIGLPKSTISFLREADTSELKLIICNKGITREQLETIEQLCPRIPIASAYGFTEARAAWVGCKDNPMAHHVFEESGTFTKDGFHLLYNGVPNGDYGDITDGPCSYCGKGIQTIYNIKRL